MLDRIKGILADYTEFPIEKMTAETEFVVDMDLSSLDVINIIMEFEEEFGVSIPDDKIGKLTNIGDVLNYLEG